MGITEFPTVLLTCTNLKRLYLSHNELTSLPRGLGNLVNLITLDLYGNKLTSIPRELCNLVNMIYLSLKNNNQLTSVHHYIIDIISTNRMDGMRPINKYGDPEFSMKAHDHVDRIVGDNTFPDLGKLCARFFSYRKTIDT